LNCLINVDILVLVFRLFKSSKFHSIVGIKIEQFWDLFYRIKWDSQNSKLTNFQILIFTLIWLRHYNTFTFLGWLTDLDKSTVKRTIDNCLNLLDDCVCKIDLPSFENRFEQSSYIWKFLVTLAIDGTEQPIYGSNDKKLKNAGYSAKKNQQSFTKLLVVTLKGKIVFLSESYLGSVTDSNLVQFPENFIRSRLKNNEWIIGDKGFKG
jgi:hypothetical protein